MEEAYFKREIGRAKAMAAAGDRPDYWAGYQRGLRRAYHGESFGTDGEHETWLSLADSDDPSRRERGRGYREGLRAAMQLKDAGALGGDS